MLMAWKIGENNLYTFKLIPVVNGWLVRLIVLWPHMTAFHDEEAKTYGEALNRQRWIAASMNRDRKQIAYSTAVTLATQIGRRYEDSSTWGRLNREVLLSL